MKFACPHCGEKTFSPIQKAFCGGMSNVGKPCMKCGVRCVNGIPSLVFRSICMCIAAVMIFYTYFTHETLSEVFWFGVVPLAAAYVLGLLFDMFIGKLVPAIKRQ
ncbi:MAG: hypothetical protein MJ071_06465 [Oscillospiraceae bacterium]|nr:hypothetical protein [Oscillospiraceae bacterium]